MNIFMIYIRDENFYQPLPEKFIKQNEEILSTEESSQIVHLCGLIQKAVEAKDKDQINLAL